MPANLENIPAPFRMRVRRLMRPSADMLGSTLCASTGLWVPASGPRASLLWSGLTFRPQWRVRGLPLGHGSWWLPWAKVSAIQPLMAVWPLWVWLTGPWTPLSLLSAACPAAGHPCLAAVSAWLASQVLSYLWSLSARETQGWVGKAEPGIRPST